ncbi:right-handed parallel beta-helix repeat-containing protein [Tamlana sp. 2201CG12-4]|uniref:right-handed parallel beta-helix repeat-containing protein n=1 Tax=Tamlana sp. 2201CG12-4 TaxID=3112582 RepID=UPI002DBC312D|nr:right-handed parallel beta-helix repeat-containing protein [Tamlana sp. 2201CG12-4]MEC3907031.1 right-handed parallel beta-helix repeat-containing protein [Tamlana sp. 2201CG12-4]
MEKSISIHIICLLACFTLCGCFSNTKTHQEFGKAYYFNATLGNDANKGASPESAWKSLRKIQKIQFKPGDKILLAAGNTFPEPIVLKNVIGTKENPIVVSTYSNTDKNKKGYIHAKGYKNGILIDNCSFVHVENLKVNASIGEIQEAKTKNSMRCGVLVKITKPGMYEQIYLSNLEVHDVFFEEEGFKRPEKEVETANGTQNYGWGIRIVNKVKNAVLKDVKVANSIIENVAHTGIKLTSKKYNGTFGIVDFEISNNKVLKTGGPGIQMSGVSNGHIHGNSVNYSGSNDDSRKWGRGSGLWTWDSDRVLIEKNHFTNANGPGDSSGAHIDYNCSNIVLQYNFSANNAGGFCEILGNSYNCAYRYNISVNDGYRIKGKNNAFQEGKIFWLSGYTGNNEKRKGPYNTYFYNNTIYSKNNIQAKIAIDRGVDGVLIANNIFHIESNATVVKGDQYNPETDGKWKVKNVFFKNNVFLHKSSWPKDQRLQDQQPIIGNANFINIKGSGAESFIPKNIKLIKDKGLEIPKIKNDTIGIVYGLNLTKDILGSNINGLPDIGAIELK